MATQGFKVVRVVPRNRTIDLVGLQSTLSAGVRPGDAIVRSKDDILIVLPEAESGARLATERLRSLVNESPGSVDVKLVQRASQPHIKATIAKVESGKIVVRARARSSPPPSEDPRYSDLLKKAGALHDRVKSLETENSSLRMELGVERALKEPEKKRRMWQRK